MLGFGVRQRERKKVSSTRPQKFGAAPDRRRRRRKLRREEKDFSKILINRRKFWQQRDE